MDVIRPLHLLPKIYYSGAVLAKSSHILPGQKYSLSIQYSFKGSQQVGKLHLPECINGMQGIWIDATFLAWNNRKRLAELLNYADAKTVSCERIVLLPLSLVSFFIFFNLMPPFFLYYLLLIAYPGQFLHHLSDTWSAVAFLHVFFSLCVHIYSYFAERFRSQTNKVQLLTLSSFGFRQLDTDHTQPPYIRGEITLKQKRWNKC